MQRPTDKRRDGNVVIIHWLANRDVIAIVHKWFLELGQIPVKFEFNILTRCCVILQMLFNVKYKLQIILQIPI